jgi:hypothetical protein
VITGQLGGISIKKVLDVRRIRAADLLQAGIEREEPVTIPQRAFVFEELLVDGGRQDRHRARKEPNITSATMKKWLMATALTSARQLRTACQLVEKRPTPVAEGCLNAHKNACFENGDALHPALSRTQHRSAADPSGKNVASR